MPRTKKNSKKYINTRRVRKGGGLMNLIRGKKKNDYKSKIDLIILALGGEEEVKRRADKVKEKLKNEQNNVVDVEKSDEQRQAEPIQKLRTPPPPPVAVPIAASAAVPTAPPPAESAPPLPPPPPSNGGRRTRKRIKK
tara:strand:+ start:846 stop:1259 length:414 start_codon:yes stop_codon:yes gene_type:complete